MYKNQSMIQYIAYRKLVYSTIVLPKITNYFHILKARIIVAYVLFHEFKACSRRGSIRNMLKKGILFLIKHPAIFFNQGFPEEIGFKRDYEQAKEIIATRYTDFFRYYVAHRKTPLADYVYVMIGTPSLGSYFHRIIGAAWLCEKLGINIKFTFSNGGIGSHNLFKNPVLNYAKVCHPENFAELKKTLTNLEYIRGKYPSPWEEYAKHEISSEYGYKIISKLSIKQEIQQKADQWCDANIKGECVGVHYRLTDAISTARVISVDSYIDYLKQVLDDHCQIYACSDTASFIDPILEAFPNRVASRNITRSNDGRALHVQLPYAGFQQREDALIDILILAKLQMIYTTGSTFIDIMRFFNPAIKIISLDGRGQSYKKKNIPNYLPTPRMDLVHKAQADNTWREGLHYNKLPHHIKTEKIVENKIAD